MASSVLDTRLSLLDKVFGASSSWTSATIRVHECSLAVSTTIPIHAHHFAQSLYLGSTTNEVRGIESRELVNEVELRTARPVNNLESVGGKQF
jgi:hypothetical protein